MNRLTFSFLFLLTFGVQQLLLAQIYQKAIGSATIDDHITAAIPDKFGNIYLSGYGTNSSLLDISMLTKLDSAGNVVWNRTYSNGIDDRYNDLIVNKKGNLVVVGSTFKFVSTDYLIVAEITTDGDTLWSKTYNNGINFNQVNLIQASDSNYIICGEVSVSGKFFDAGLMKLNQQGDTIWCRAVGGSDRETMYDVTETTDGGFVMTGETKSYGAGGKDIYVAKFDMDGSFLWDFVYGGPDNDISESVIELSDGTLLIAGSTENAGAGSYDALVLNLSTNGTLNWAKTYGSSDLEYGQKLYKIKSNEILMLGETDYQVGGNRDIYWVKINQSGDTLSTGAYGLNGSQKPRGFVTNKSGESVIIGTVTIYTTTFFDMAYFVKIDKDENSCNERLSETIVNNVAGQLTATLAGEDTTFIPELIVQGIGEDSLNLIDTTLCVTCELAAEITVTEIVDSCDGSMTVNITEGFAPYKYLWNDSQIQTTANATGLCEGIYSTTVSDSLGCSVVLGDTLIFPMDTTTWIKDTETINIRFFPNPVNNKLTITGITLNTNYNLIVYNTVGKVIHSTAFNSVSSVIQLNVQHLNSGIYFCEVKTDTGAVIFKWVKE